MDDRVLDEAEMRDVLRLLHRELGATPAPPPEPTQPWRTCAGCRRRPAFTYTRGGRRYCPDCWDGPPGPLLWTDLPDQEDIGA